MSLTLRQAPVSMVFQPRFGKELTKQAASAKRKANEG